LGTLVVLAVVTACDKRTELVEEPSPLVDVTGGSDEEEVFGDVVGFGGLSLFTELQPRDVASEANQPAYASRYVQLSPSHANKGADFGWYGIGPNYPTCVSATDQSLNAPEVHVGSSDQQEEHCVRSGRFVESLLDGDVPVTVAGYSVSREVDYIEFDGTVTTAEGTHTIESNQPISPAGHTQDVIVLFDDTMDGATGTIRLEIDHPASRTAPTWAGAQVNEGQTIQGLATDWFRLGAWKSTKNWTDLATDRGVLLVRYFWNYDGDRSDRSGFTNTINEQRGVIRVRRFSPGTHRVVAQLVQPDEYGAMTDGVSWGASRSFLIRSCDPTLTASFAYAPTSPVVGQTVQFTAFTGQGGDGCGSLEYRWLVDDVERQGWSASPAFDHQFTSGGSHSVRLDKRSEGGAPASSTQTVNVTGPPPLSVSITFGPSSVRPTFPDCQWRATVQGGQPPYQYTWKLNGKQVVGTTARLTMTTLTTNFTLVVIATDRTQADTANRAVAVFAGAPPCP
jgi:hypothetical protein